MKEKMKLLRHVFNGRRQGVQGGWYASIILSRFYIYFYYRKTGSSRIKAKTCNFKRLDSVATIKSISLLFSRFHSSVIQERPERLTTYLQKNCVFATNSDFLIPISLQPYVVQTMNSIISKYQRFPPLSCNDNEIKQF